MRRGGGGGGGGVVEKEEGFKGICARQTFFSFSLSLSLSLRKSEQRKLQHVFFWLSYFCFFFRWLCWKGTRPCCFTFISSPCTLAREAHL
jgi:hypothetical protein